MLLRSIEEINRLIVKGISHAYLNISYFKIKPVFLYWMFLRSIKEVNRLISKVKYLLKQFLLRKTDTLKNFWQAPNHADITEFENFLLQLKKSEVQEKTL